MKWILNEDRPIWVQLKEQLGKQIVAGRFVCGERLPSVRDLAKEAGVNPNTMQRALSALDQDGLTITNRTAGRCITEDQEKIKRRSTRYEKYLLKRLWKTTSLRWKHLDMMQSRQNTF